MPVGGGFSSCGCGGSECASPTTPIATTGLCLPDGTPLAVVAERDCVGTVQQTGWLNLATGAYTTGVPPAGAGACGDSRSIQTAGVFCDVGEDGTVFGLVVVEYHYDDTGAIESVRLVSAATGTTYTLQGTLTVCPSGDDGDESPGELAVAVRQVVERCGCDDTNGDGIGDVRYVELWSVDTTGATPPFLVGTYVDGDFDQPYIPATPVDCSTMTDPGGDESPGEPETTCAPQIVERCGCDDQDGDGLADVRYVELWAVDPCGTNAPALLGTWRDGDFDQPYTPVAPVDCVDAGGDESPGPLPVTFEVAPVPLCVIDDATGSVLQNILAEVVYDQTTGERTGVRYVDQVTGAPVPVPGGAHLAVCPAAETCNDCTRLVLCDVDAASPATIAGATASGRLANGVTWSAKGTGGVFAASRQSDGASWWGLALFPNPTTSVTTWTFDQPVTVDFSVGMSYVADATPGQNTAQLPAGAIPLSLPAGYTYDRATSILAVDATVTGCPPIQTPTREITARFRVTGVTTMSMQYLGTRALVPDCKVFGNWAFGALDVSLGGQFLRTVCKGGDGTVTTVTDTLLDGATPYTPVGEVGVCMPATPDEPCPSTVQVLRLCDLNPDVDPDADGNRCATPFLRHLVYDCTGAVTSTLDTAPDGVTTYTPIQVVDCGTSGVPALSELAWPLTGIDDDPAGTAGRAYIYTLTNPQTGEAAHVGLTTSTTAGTGCVFTGPPSPTNPPTFNNPTNYTYTLDTAAQAMSRFTLVFQDLDPFEGVRSLNPVPDGVVFDVGAGTWNGASISATVNNSVARAYWNTPPATVSHSYANTGGGLACLSAVLAGTTLVPDGCCTCGGDSDGSTSPGEPQPCRDTATVLLCDVPASDTTTLTATMTDSTGTASGAPAGWGGRDLAGPYTALWSGGTLNIPATAGPNADTTAVAGVLTAAVPAGCEDATATLTVSVQVTNNGPAAGQVWDGTLQLLKAGTVIKDAPFPTSAPAGATFVRTISVPVTLADLASGDLHVLLGFETYHLGAKSWTANQFSATVDLQGCEQTTATQFLRTLVTDCETGQITSTVDTTLDGAPYTVGGTVGQCQPVPSGGDTSQNQECQSIILCDTPDGGGTPHEFLRTVCRDATGVVAAVTDTELDGTTSYAPAGTVGQCQPVQCTDTQICVRPSGNVEFISNAGDVADGSVDPVWSWAQDPAATTWYDIYRVGIFPGWTTTDPGTAAGTAHWVAPHPDATTENTGLPGEGPTIDASEPEWYARASFDLPSFADPATIRISATVLNADQLAVEWRLNDGPWQPVNRSHVDAPYTLTPTAVPGAQAGTNTLYVHVRETVFGSGAAGLMVHLIADYDVDATAYEPWTRIACPDGTTTYLDPQGQTQAALPADAAVVPCPGGSGGTGADVVACDGGNALLVKVCHDDESPGAEPCRNSTALLVCDLPQDGTPTPTATDTNPTPYYSDPVAAPVTGAQSLWSGGTLTLPPGTAPQPGTIGTVNTLAATVTAARPACDDGTATVTASVLVAQTGPDDGCGPTGHLRLFNGTQQIALMVVPANTPVGWSGTLTVTATVPAADLAAGNVALVLALDAYDGGLSCTPSPRETGWNLSQFTASTVYDQITCAQQVLANVVTDCATGQVDSVTYTMMDGTPYTPTGEVGQCTTTAPTAPGQPCGDTEVATLCDLVYSPQAPIPTPADTFTLTGNVVLTGGNALWFAQANQDATGIAELTVGGLLPAVMYEFRFESAWVGAGSPDPATNNAVYLLEILDGTSVIATRTRNVSNGSSVSPGAVLTEDLPPLAVIAPTSGSVTIRFTDQTTGGGANDRDLLISPLELRTAALTIASTPFLRAMTFDCTGLLTGTQDLAVDGSGAYAVQGVVGTCGASDEGGGTVARGPDIDVLVLCDLAADGTSTGFLRILTIAADGTVTTADTELDGVTTYTPAGTVGVCDTGAGDPDCPRHLREECRWDDTDGDGVGDVRYVELIAVDGCTGALTTVGTYKPELTGPYTPVAPVADGPVAGAPAARGIQAHRLLVAAGGTWDASTVPLLQAVTVVARGTATVTTADGASDLVAGESIGWSVTRDSDATLVGPLTVTAGDGPVAIAWTASVAL